MVIKLPPMEVDYYHTTHQAAARLSNDCNRLLLPRDAGQTAMDGIIGPAFCMQVSSRLSFGSIVIMFPSCHRSADLHRPCSKL